MKSTRNPFFAGKAVSDADRFFGRQDLVKDIVNTLTNTHESVVLLHGQRRIGKSSLLYRLQRDDILRQTHLPIIFDMQNYEDLSLSRILNILADEIRTALGAEIPLPTEEVLAADAFVFKKIFLPQIYERLVDRRLLILIDEFDAISRNSDDSSENVFLIYLRSLLAEDQAHLAFIFVISQRLDQLSGNYLRLIKAASAKPVGRFKKAEAVKLLTELGDQGNMSFTAEALDEIWRLTSGHPYLTQLFGREIFEQIRGNDNRQVDRAGVMACEHRAIETAEAVLTWFWKDLARVECLVLSAIAELTSPDLSVNNAKINETLQKHSLARTHTELRDAYKFLLDGDFLIDAGQQHYKFAVEIIRRWVVQRHPLKEAQREMEQIGVEALNHYQAGTANFTQGNLVEAIKHFRRALDHNDKFADAWLGLAAALNGAREQEGAIAACETAFDLNPVEESRKRLIRLRMNYAKELQESDRQAELLAQTERVLAIDPDHPQAREVVSDIWLERIGANLGEDNFPAALDLVKHLVEPVPLLQDTRIAQRVRSMWLKYSLKLSQDNFKLVQAEEVLQSLAKFKLEDDSVKESFNTLILKKALVFLEEDQIKLALDTLKNELKKPLPTSEIKALLRNYSQQQIERQAWSEANQLLELLVELVKDNDSINAQNNLYHHWGKDLRAKKEFDAAVKIYQRGQSKVFTPEIAATYLEQGEFYLSREQLSQVKSSYQKAIHIHRNKPTREYARETLVAILARYRSERAWPKAKHTLQILQELDLAGEDGDNWQTDMHFEQAEDDLSRENLDAAFGWLAAHAADHPDRIKMLLKNYLKIAALKDHWDVGRDALKRLGDLLSPDEEATCWRANWLYLWAKACFLKETLKRDPARAWGLCQEILSIPLDEIPLLDLLNGIDIVPEKKGDNLRQHVCYLATDIALEQAQHNLNQAELAAASNHFEEALVLPIPPDGLKLKIRNMLLDYSKSQLLKGEKNEAQQALETILDLDLGDQRETIEVLKKIPVTDAQLLLKADLPSKAFQSLKPNNSDLSNEERGVIRAMGYQFSRLYAGRDCWDKAQQALVGLQEWLGPAGDDIATMRDMLNREHLNFIKGQTASTPVPSDELNRLNNELKVAKTGYQEARELGLDSTGVWAEDFISAGLKLGQSHLNNSKLENAIQAFKEILEVEAPVPTHREQISQSLHNYSARVMKDQNWVEAEHTLKQLETFNLTAPDNQTRPDYRIYGAIQHVILDQIQCQLNNDHLPEEEDALMKLPQPRPTGEVKRIFFDYSKRCRAQNAWENAAEALKRLDTFLQHDHSETRDQQTLGERVSCLENWASHLEKGDDLDQAAAKYHESLEHTRNAAHPRNMELAGHFIRVTLQLAQQSLAEDPLGPEPPEVLDKALDHCAAVLTLTECTPTEKETVNTTLYDHACKLANAGQWLRASQLLEDLDELYVPTPPDAYKTTFARWRRILVLGEVEKHLTRPQPDLDQAFTLLRDLKKRLEIYDAPDVSWRVSQGQIKEVINTFCGRWNAQTQWVWATDSLGRLSGLIPEDKEVVGWRVTTLSDWGQYLQHKNSLAEAIEHYSQALSLAPEQGIVPPDKIAEYLLQTQLALAKQHLEDQVVSEAIRIYETILENPPDYLHRADRIRQAVMDHCDTLVNQNPPQWQRAHQLRNKLLALNLDSEQVQCWHQNLTLQHLNLLLQQCKIDQAFDCLNNLVGDWPLTDIEQVIQQYAGDQAQADTWRNALEALVYFGRRRADDKTVRAWVKQELITLGKSLGDQDLLEASLEVLRGAREFE